VSKSARVARPHDVCSQKFCDVCSGLQGTSRFQGIHFLVENWALLSDFAPTQGKNHQLLVAIGQACSHSFGLIHTGISVHSFKS